MLNNPLQLWRRGTIREVIWSRFACHFCTVYCWLAFLLFTMVIIFIIHFLLLYSFMMNHFVLTDPWSQLHRWFFYNVRSKVRWQGWLCPTENQKQQQQQQKETMKHLKDLTYRPLKIGRRDTKLRSQLFWKHLSDGWATFWMQNASSYSQNHSW